MFRLKQRTGSRRTKQVNYNAKFSEPLTYPSDNCFFNVFISYAINFTVSTVRV